MKLHSQSIQMVLFLLILMIFCLPCLLLFPTFSLGSSSARSSNWKECWKQHTKTRDTRCAFDSCQHHTNLTTHTKQTRTQHRKRMESVCANAENGRLLPTAKGRVHDDVSVRWFAYYEALGLSRFPPIYVPRQVRSDDIRSVSIP